MTQPCHQKRSGSADKASSVADFQAHSKSHKFKTLYIYIGTNAGFGQLHNSEYYPCICLQRLNKIIKTGLVAEI
jgi:hypothetical protein